MSVIIDNVCSVEESMQCAFCNQTKNQSFIIGLLGEPRVSTKIKHNNNWFQKNLNFLELNCRNVTRDKLIQSLMLVSLPLSYFHLLLVTFLSFD